MRVRGIHHHDDVDRFSTVYVYLSRRSVTHMDTYRGMTLLLHGHLQGDDALGLPQVLGQSPMLRRRAEYTQYGL